MFIRAHTLLLPSSTPHVTSLRYPKGGVVVAWYTCGTINPSSCFLGPATSAVRELHLVLFVLSPPPSEISTSPLSPEINKCSGELNQGNKVPMLNFHFKSSSKTCFKKSPYSSSTLHKILRENAQKKSTPELSIYLAQRNTPKLPGF